MGKSTGLEPDGLGLLCPTRVTIFKLLHLSVPPALPLETGGCLPPRVDERSRVL